MSNQGLFKTMSITLIVSALVLALLGVYFMVARQNYVVGAVIMLVALSDVGLAMFFARRSQS